MRRFLAFALLASAAVPALAAQDQGRFGRHHDSAQQSNQNEGNRSGDRHGDRGNRGNGGGGNEQQQQNSQPQHQRPVMHVESTAGGGGNNSEPRHFNGMPSRFSSGNQDRSIQPRGGEGSGQQPDSVRNWRSGERERNRGPRVVTPTQVDVTPTLRQPNHDAPSVFRHRVPVVSDAPREGTQPRLRTDRRRGDAVTWNTTRWRSDHRYNWQDWRRHNRSLFHLSIYYDPFGWNYRPYQIGWRLWPSYYSSRYWINDPYEYRLPYAPPGYRWIRYYDDALLVDTWNGQVVDVIYNFFW